MILTCPECATSYFVADESVPPQGRSVKCSNCANRWRAFPVVEVDEIAEIVAAPVAAPEPAATAAPEPSTSAEPGLLPEDLEIIEAPRRPVRAKVAGQPRRGAGAAILAGLGVAAVLALAVGAIVMRNDIVRAVPATGQVFAALGAPADPLGLKIEQVKFQATFEGGRPVLAVTGAIHNVRDRTVEAPPLRITLLDKAGKPLTAKVARPLNGAVPAGGKRYFALNIADPPAGVDDPRIEFDAAAHVADHAPAHGHEPVEAVLTPEPQEAKPLPPESPDALPTHG